jgi:hypothetical protein
MGEKNSCGKCFEHAEYRQEQQLGKRSWVGGMVV